MRHYIFDGDSLDRGSHPTLRSVLTVVNWNLSHRNTLIWIQSLSLESYNICDITLAIVIQLKILHTSNSKVCISSRYSRFVSSEALRFEFRGGREFFSWITIRDINVTHWLDWQTRASECQLEDFTWDKFQATTINTGSTFKSECPATRSEFHTTTINTRI